MAKSSGSLESLGNRTVQLGRDLRMLFRFAGAYPHFVRDPVTSAAAMASVQARLAERTKNFLNLLEERIYKYPKSPYLPLLRSAGCELGDLQNMVASRGIEQTLASLADSGLRISIDEFKAYTPLVREHVRLSLVESDFDNPFLAHHLEVRSGGTRSAGTSVLLDLAFIRALVDDTALAFDAHQLWGATQAVWLPVGGAGLSPILIYAKLGRPPARWFTQRELRRMDFRRRWAQRFVLLWGNVTGGKFPFPRYAGLGDAPRVAGWVAQEIKEGRRSCLTTYASSAVRICQSAAREGLDLKGSVFITIGEPLTKAKRRVIEEAGASVVVRYAATEAGILGYGCAEPREPDDLHFLRDNFALIRYRRPVGPERIPVQALLITSLLPESPKVLLNVEMGDSAEVTERECGCVLGRAGLTTHLSEVRSFEKLTGEGMTFFGTPLIGVLEEELPARLGGRTTDYQLLESEDDTGITRLELRVDPSVGPVDENQVIETFFACLEARPGLRPMVGLWRQAKILRVRRVQPLSTAAGKILPFHLMKRQPGSGNPGA